MADIKTVIEVIEHCSNGYDCKGCPYSNLYGRLDCIDQQRIDALELLKEQQKKKSKKEVLYAIISSLGYTDIETFKRTVLEIDNFEDYFLGGMLRAVQAVEKLFEA